MTLSHDNANYCGICKNKSAKGFRYLQIGMGLFLLFQSPAWENLISLVRAVKGSVTSPEGLDCGGYVKRHWDAETHSFLSSPILSDPTPQHRLIAHSLLGTCLPQTKYSGILLGKWWRADVWVWRKEEYSLPPAYSSPRLVWKGLSCFQGRIRDREAGNSRMKLATPGYVI